MKPSDMPRPYHEWRSDSIDRAEDAAYLFGSHLIKHCRTEALKRIESQPVPVSVEEFQTQVASAVDHALHNVMDLLEGFWPTKADENHRVEYELSVRVKDASRTMIERVPISPCLLDLPIGYWKWKDGEFR